MKKYPKVKFRALYEVHDKPAINNEKGKKDTIGADVPGFREEQKRRDIAEGVFRYFTHIWDLESILRNEIRAAGGADDKMPRMIHSIDELLLAVNRVLGEARNSNDTERVFIMGVGGVTGTGKTNYISGFLRDFLKDEICIIQADRFVFPKWARPVNKVYPESLYDLQAIEATIKAIKEKKSIGVPLYSAEKRGRLYLDDDTLASLKREGLSPLRLYNYDAPFLPVNNSRVYEPLLSNKDSCVAVNTITGELVEVPADNKTIFYFETSSAQILSREGEKYDISIFVWARPETRSCNLKNAKSLGQRLMHYDEKQIEERLRQMREKEDEVVLRSAPDADIIFINEDRTEKTKDLPKNLSRGSVDEIGQTNPELERDANDGRMIEDPIIGDSMRERWCLANDLLYDDLQDETRVYTISYDESLVLQEEDIKLYARLLEKNAKAKVELKKHSKNNAPGRALIEVSCSGDDFTGTGGVDVAGYNGEERTFRIIDMLNIAVAAASISDKEKEGDLTDQAKKLVSYIKRQLQSFAGETSALPDTDNELLRLLKTKSLELPPAFMIEYDKAQEYEAIANEALLRA